MNDRNDANARVNWADIEWVILDMDGTILDLAFDNYFWRELLPERYAQRRGLALDAARAELAPRFAEVQHTLPWYCTDHWSRVTGLDLATLKREVRARIAPLQGAVEFLHAVKASGRQLWLATNAHRDSWALKLEHTQLTSLFDEIHSSHDFGVAKEDARFWTRLAAKSGFDARRALFADDSLPVLQAARDYGIAQVVAIRHPDSTLPKRDLRDMAAVDRLADLLPIV